MAFVAVYLDGVTVDDRRATDKHLGTGLDWYGENEYRQKRNCTDHDMDCRHLMRQKQVIGNELYRR